MRRFLLALSVALMLWSVSAGAVSAQSDGYVQAAYDACATHGCDGSWLVSIIACETGGTWDHGSVGPNGERGLLQYHPQGLWPELAWADPYTQIDHAAWAISNGYAGEWVCSGV